jgi:mannose/fructose-specific phosphotransferase system component IIA
MTKPPFPILLVTHPGFAEGLLKAAEAILGTRPEVEIFSNHDIAPQDQEVLIERWLGAHPGPVLVLTDLGFGSCTTAARRVARDRPEVGIVAGANLPLFLAALRSRSHEDLGTFLEHLATRGRVGVEAYLGDRRL